MVSLLRPPDKRTAHLPLKPEHAGEEVDDAEFVKSSAREDWSRAVTKLQAVRAFGVGNLASEGGPKEQNGGTGVKVLVRVRPFIREEYERDGGRPVLCMHMPTKTHLELLHPDYSKKTFEFDRTYWSFAERCDHSPHFASQELIYQELGTTLLDHAIAGFNNCIFAYGQTASGKSHSVLGTTTPEGRGLLPRIVHGLFEHFQNLPKLCTCKCLVSFMEIYNEQIRDLLVHNADHPDSQDCPWNASMEKQRSEKSKLDVRQHPILGIIVPGLTEAAVGCEEDVFEFIEYGITVRTVGATAMNYCSSRSHCIFTFRTSITNSEGIALRSQTHLVDLAGSERLAKTKATSTRLKEGVAINQSLSNLALVINALAENSTQVQGDGKRKPACVPPFRNSKLTYILKESLCGNSKTVMMAAVSPSLSDYEETLSTLKFAQSAKRVQTHAVKNEVSESGIQHQLQQEINRLREELSNITKMRAADAELLTSKEDMLKEAEVICSNFGMPWADLLAAERAKHRRRMATWDIPDLDGLRNLYEAAQNSNLCSAASKDLFGECSTTSKSSSGGSSSSEASEHWSDGAGSPPGFGSIGDAHRPRSSGGCRSSARHDRAARGVPLRSSSDNIKNRSSAQSTQASSSTTARSRTTTGFLDLCRVSSANQQMSLLLHSDGLVGQNSFKIINKRRSSAGATSGIAIVGSACESLLQEEPKAAAIRALAFTEKFRELQVLASEMQALLDAASPPIVPPVQLQAMVAINPFDALNPQLVVTAKRCGGYSALDIFDSDEVFKYASQQEPKIEVDMAEEWLSASELRARLDWMQSGEAEAVSTSTEPAPDLWLQSKASSKRASSFCNWQSRLRKESPRSLTVNSSVLHAELTAAQSDLTVIRSELAAERSAAAEVRATLERCELALERAETSASHAWVQAPLSPLAADAAAGAALVPTMLKPSFTVTELEARKGCGLLDIVAACGQQTSRLRQFGADVEASYNKAMVALDSLQAVTAPGDTAAATKCKSVAIS